MRRLRLALLLPLMLVLAQQGALLHELSHAYYSAGVTAGTELRQGRLLADSNPCALCLAFAQVATPAAASLTALPASPALPQLGPEPRYSITAAPRPTPRSRGPPSA